MNRHVNAIAGRLSLRKPQRDSLEILDRITEIAPPRKKPDLAAALAAIRAEYPTVTDYEREFPSVCFALATGVGKTRLMGAFISYLHLVHGINNFFVMAPNLTIYNKLITDFTPNTPKYVFKGISEFNVDSPEIVTGENYERPVTLGNLYKVRINIFNVSKLTAEARGGKPLRMRRVQDYWPEGYFEYLAALPDLVLIMDESHRYRASAGVRAINELKPVVGLELTATPFVETAKGPVPFKNVIYDYPLGRAMADGFVKEPAVVTQKNFDPKQFSPERLEEIKLQDGVRLHENTKVELETYARQTGERIVKPFMLVIARDTTHAGQLLNLIQSAEFFEGKYRDKVIQVDSSKTGAEEDEMIERLLKVEHAEEPTEIVIHVNMLKEGWDVTNLYTIVPLRAANARTLIEQSIGRGLRLPYGKRTGVSVVDRLNIVAHDRFDEIVAEANRPESAIRLQQVILDPAGAAQKPETVVSRPHVAQRLAPAPNEAEAAEPLFKSPVERTIAQVTFELIQKHETVAGSAELLKPEVQAKLVAQVAERIAPAQQELAGVAEPPNVVEIVKKTTGFVIEQTIDIPRILVIPRGLTIGYHRFELDTASIQYQPVERDLLIQKLRTNEQETLAYGAPVQQELRLEDYLVRALMDYDDVHYDEHAELLYDLAAQLVKHLRSYLSEDDTRNVLIYHQKQLAAFIHAQMQQHQWEKATEYEVVVSKGFTTLKESAFTKLDGESIHDFRQTVADKTKIPQMVFGGFRRCLYPKQKFQSDTERKMALILDREATKWFKPALGQLQIFYKDGTDQAEYQPDFVAETDSQIYMLETKQRKEMEAPVVTAKKEAAIKWCARATTHTRNNSGKPWQYALIPHDAVAENMSLKALVMQSA